MKKIIIPKKIKKRVSKHSDKFYNYEFVEKTKRLVVYKCIETGRLESFNKIDFIKEVEDMELAILRVGECGLEKCTEGMYARTKSGVIGRVINSNSDDLLIGVELISNDKKHIVERDAITKIKGDPKELIEEGDFVYYKLPNSALLHTGLAEKTSLDAIQINYCKLINLRIMAILPKEKIEADKYIVDKGV